MNEKDLKILAKKIKVWGHELGFQQVGITNTELTKDSVHLRKWLDNNYHGDMEYMSNHADLRADPKKLMPKTLSVISLTMNYLPPEVETVKLLDHPDLAYISRYAVGRDYHKLIRKRIKKLSEKIMQYGYKNSFRPFVDSAPVLERALAQKAGLGWIGKNTMLINTSKGSWFFLGELFTSLDLPIDEPINKNHCGTCTACLDICPTNAFVGPNQLDARRCISYLTIEHKGSIPESLRKKIGNRVFGCDDCQLICPWNKFAKPTDERDFSPRYNIDKIKLVDLFTWTEEEFNKKTLGSPIKRIGYERWLRNLAVGLGNGIKSSSIIEVLKSRLGVSNLVDEHIKWAIKSQRNQTN